MAHPSGPGGGFTLLELLVVIAIITILSGIALPQYLGMVERSRGSEAMTTLALIRSAEVRFQAENPQETYTTTWSKLDITVQPQTPLWSYTLQSTGATAKRNGLTPIRCLVVNFDQGTFCSSHPSLYKVATSCACP